MPEATVGRHQRPKPPDEQPPGGHGFRDDGPLDDGLRDDGLRFVEEELPPDFWDASVEEDDIPTAHPPGGDRRATERRATRQGSDRKSSAGEGSTPVGDSGETRPEPRPSSIPAGTDDEEEPAETDYPAFAALQRLFPGRVISVEAPAADEVDELVPSVPGEGGEGQVSEAELTGEEGDEESRD